MAGIATLSIQENAAWSDALSSSDEPKESCSSFTLTEADVRDYFRRAARVDWALWNYLPYSRCYARGEVTFTHGGRGAWHIDRNRRGKLVLSDGRVGYFYGKQARAKVFEEPSPYFDDPLFDVKPMAKPGKKRGIGSVVSVTFRAGDFMYPVSDAQSRGQCRFELRDEDVKAFLSNANVISQREYGQIPPADCHLEGDVVLADGRTGAWMIEQGRRGILQMKGGPKTYLFGKTVLSKAFAPLK